MALKPHNNALFKLMMMFGGKITFQTHTCLLVLHLCMVPTFEVYLVLTKKVVNSKHDFLGRYCSHDLFLSPSFFFFISRRSLCTFWELSGDFVEGCTVCISKREAMSFQHFLLKMSTITLDRPPGYSLG